MSERTFSDVIEEIHAELPGLIHREGIPGLSIAVANTRAILWEAGYGVADRSTGKPVTPETLFSMQSCSKTFTATAILLAVQDGLLSLDCPIEEYLPGFRLQSRYDGQPGRKITLRLLLSHKAGFTHEAPVGNNYQSDEAMGSFEKHIASIQAGWLRFPVGQRYSYANLGIDLAGYILQKVSGMPFAEYVRQKLFLPLGMTGSTFSFESFQRSDNRAAGHDLFFDAVGKKAPRRVPMIPAGGLYTSAHDVARFIQFHINRGRVNGRVVLEEKYLDEMYTIPLPEEGQFEGYALGVGLVRRQPPALYSHCGGGFGFLADMLWSAELEIGVVMLTNSSSHELQWSYSSGVLKKIAGLRAYRDKMPESREPEETPALAQPDEGRLGALLGHYAGRMPAQLWVQRASGGGLAIKFKGVKDPQPLSFTSDTDAFTRNGGNLIRYRFVLDEQGRPERLVCLDNGNVYDFNAGPGEGPGPNKAAWRACLGTYVALINGIIPDITRIYRKNGHLYMNKMIYRYVLRLSEYRPGLFFTSTGEVVDFTGEAPVFAGVVVSKIGLGTELSLWWVWLRYILRQWIMGLRKRRPSRSGSQSE